MRPGPMQRLKELRLVETVLDAYIHGALLNEEDAINEWLDKRDEEIVAGKEKT